MANNQPIKPDQSGDNKPSLLDQFEQAIENVIRPLASKLGSLAVPFTKAGELLGGAISNGIDKVFEIDNNNNTNNN